MFCLAMVSVACSDDDDVVVVAPDTEPPSLVIGSSRVDVPEAGGSYSVSFDLEHPIEGEQVCAANQEAWISGLKVMMVNAGQGVVSFAVAANEGDARSTDVVLTYKNAQEQKFTVLQAAHEAVEPDEGTAPELFLNLHYEPAAQVVAADMNCPSKNASKASFACVPVKALEDVMKNQGLTLEQIMAPDFGVATLFSAEMMDLLNGEGFENEIIAYWSPELAGLELVAILVAENEHGQTIVQSKTLVEEGQTPEPPQPGVGPEMDFEVYKNETGDVIYFARCLTQNVASGEIITDSKALFDEMLSRFGNDLEVLADAGAGSGQQLIEDWILKINTEEGLELSVKNPNPNVTYAGLLIAYDAEHHRTVNYAHEPVAPEPEPEPQTGNLQLDFEVVTEMNGFNVRSSCPTHNAETAWIIWTDPLELNSKLSHGSTLESVMDEAIEDKGRGRAQKYETKWINEMNEGWCELFLGGNPGMTFAFVLDVRNTEDRVVKRVDALIEEYSGDSYVQSLTDADFRELVWDYNLNPEFTFRGQRPCILNFGAPEWCGWCQELIPVMMQASVEYQGRVDFYDIDTDYETEAYNAIVQDLNAGNSIPLLIMVDKLGRCTIIGGYIPLSDMCDYLDEMLANETAPAKDAPVIKLDAYRTPEDRAVFLNYCTSEDAYSAELVYSPLSDFNLWFESFDMESLADALKGSGMQFPSDWLARFNSPEGVGIQVRAAVGDTYAVMLIAYNTKGRSIAYAVADKVRTTSPKPMSVAQQPQTMKQTLIAARPDNLLDRRCAYHIAPTSMPQTAWISVDLNRGFAPALRNVARFAR